MAKRKSLGAESVDDSEFTASDASDGESCDESYDESDHPSTSQSKPKPAKQATQYNGEKKFACTYDGCTKRYAKVGKLNRHMATHSGVRAHSCSHCSLSFVRADHRNMHEKRKHSAISDVDKPFKCTFAGCSSSFFSSSHLRRHLASSVHRVKTFACTITGCAESFVKKSQLKSHISNTHPESLELVFKCAFAPCTLAFATRPQLTKHVHLQHTVRRYVCSDCSEEFTRFLLWQQHCSKAHPKSSSEDQPLVTPSTRRSFACTHADCTKSYSSQWNLSNHTRIVHEGVRAFSCPHCEQGFAYKSNLKKHIQIQHELVLTEDDDGIETVRFSRFGAKNTVFGRITAAANPVSEPDAEAENDSKTNGDAMADEPQAKRMRMSPPIDETPAAPVEVM